MGLLGDLMPEVKRQMGIAETKRQYTRDIDKWARDILDIHLWAKQIEIAEALVHGRRVAVAAGHAVGKSYVAAIICLWWWDTHPLEEDKTFIATTAPSKEQVDLIWGNIRQMHARMNRRYAEGKIDHGMPGYITGDNKFKLDDGQQLGGGRKPPDSKSDIAFQGRHAAFLLAIGDEAVGLSEGFLNALEVIATGDANKILLLANPTDPSCAMARIWPDPEGRGGKSEWERIHISVLDSPLIAKPPGWERYKDVGMSGEKFLKRAEEDYGGKEDPRYIARVLGQWAWDSGLGLFPEEIISRSVRTQVVPYSWSKARFGVDVARMGVDSTVIYICEEGEVWETDPETGELSNPTGVTGLRFRKVDSWNRVKVTSRDPENLGSAQRIDKLALEWGVESVNIDAGGGLGGGLFDAIEDSWADNPRQQSYNLFEIDGSSLRGIDRRAYINLRAFAFSELKRRMNLGEVDLDIEDEVLLDQFRGIRAKVSNGSALQIESKEDMKKRGAKSPDNADAVWYSSVDTVDPDGMMPGETQQIDPYDHVPDEYSRNWDMIAGY